MFHPRNEDRSVCIREGGTVVQVVRPAAADLGAFHLEMNPTERWHTLRQVTASGTTCTTRTTSFMWG